MEKYFEVSRAGIGTLSQQSKNNVEAEVEQKASLTKDDASTKIVPVGGDKYNLLGEAIHFYDKPSLKKHAKVPPPTPAYDIDYQRPIVHQPVVVSHVRTDDLPKVSDSGIRFSIQALGKILGYDEYEYDLVQFWLLDILTDCLWKAQDVFQFQEAEQKVILEWVTAIFKLITDPNLDLSRKQFLRLFKNVLFALYKHITESCEQFPEPRFIDHHVRELIEQEEMVDASSSDSESDDDDDDDSTSSSSSVGGRAQASVSTFSITSNDARKIRIQPEFDIAEHINHLKKNNPVGNIVHAYSDQCLVTEPSDGGEEEEQDITNDYSASQITNDSAQFIANTYPFWAKYKKFKPPDQICTCDPAHLSKIFCTCVNPYVLGGEDADYSNAVISMTQQKSSSDRSTVISALTHQDSGQSSTSPSRRQAIDENIKSASGQVIDYLTTSQVAALRPQSATATSLSHAHGDSEINRSAAPPKLASAQPTAEIADIDQNAAELEVARQKELELDKQRQLEVERQHELELERQNEIEILKEWAYFELMAQRNWDMNDPSVGWVPWLSWLEGQADGGTNLQENFAAAAVSFAKDTSSTDPVDAINMPSPECPELRKLNFHILKAIVDFVFEYFYENFHFTLIKLAFRCPPNLITQAINQEWNIPKAMKTPFKRPKEVKPKKEKRSKSKESKKSKRSSKSSKSKKSKSSKSSKKGKKDKKKNKDKKDKKDKKSKKEKKGKPKLTPEEQAELERKREEAERLEEERQKSEENRVYLFPLADAASEHLFMSIFENWVKAKEADDDDDTSKKSKKGKQNKKDKKGKKKK